MIRTLLILSLAALFTACSSDPEPVSDTADADSDIVSDATDAADADDTAEDGTPPLDGAEDPSESDADSGEDAPDADDDSVEPDATEDTAPDAEEDAIVDAESDVTQDPIPDVSPDAQADLGVPDNCPDLIRAIEAELVAVRSCEEGAECGQPITGTSCGCTRDLVARIDADLAHFRALAAAIFALECEYGFISTCDCPAADGYECTAGFCAWNYL